MTNTQGAGLNRAAGPKEGCSNMYIGLGFICLYAFVVFFSMIEI